jgi:hypothetical protein
MVEVVGRQADLAQQGLRVTTVAADVVGVADQRHAANVVLLDALDHGWRPRMPHRPSDNPESADGRVSFDVAAAIGKANGAEFVPGVACASRPPPHPAGGKRCI